jgi:hypothetical protein
MLPTSRVMDRTEQEQREAEARFLARLEQGRKLFQAGLLADPQKRLSKSLEALAKVTKPNTSS